MQVPTQWKPQAAFETSETSLFGSKVCGDLAVLRLPRTLPAGPVMDTWTVGIQPGTRCGSVEQNRVT
jgi:hypothetical protein